MKKIFLLAFSLISFSSSILFSEAISVINGRVYQGNRSVTVIDLGFVQFGSIDGKSFCETTLIIDLMLGAASTMAIYNNLNDFRKENTENANLSNWNLFKKYIVEKFPNYNAEFIIPAFILSCYSAKLIKNTVS